MLKSELKRIYSEAMRIGTLVPWKDNNFIEPRYKPVVIKQKNDISYIQREDIFSLNNADYEDDYESCYDIKDTFYVYCIKEGLESGCPPVSYEDIVNKKLFIGNNGAFWLINNECELDYVKVFDNYLLLADDSKFDKFDVLDKFGVLLDMVAFGKYIDTLKRGYTNLF